MLTKEKIFKMMDNEYRKVEEYSPKWQEEFDRTDKFVYYGICEYARGMVRAFSDILEDMGIDEQFDGRYNLVL